MSLPPSEIPQGAIRFNTDSQRLEFYAQGQWWIMSTDTPNLGNAVLPQEPGVRGLFAGGYAPSPVQYSNTIDFVNINSRGNALNFGDLANKAVAGGGVASSTRGLFAGGYVAGSPNKYDQIDYVTIASTGNALDFGDLANAANIRKGAVGNATRGMWGGGQTAPQNVLTSSIDYVTIASTGDTVNFGDLSVARTRFSGAGSVTRGIFAGGFSNPPSVYYNTIDYITIASSGTASDFGDMQLPLTWTAACSNATRMLISGGDQAPASTNIMEYVQIATTGNAMTFGDLFYVIDTGTYAGAGAASPTRGVFNTGLYKNPSATYHNVMYYVQISTLGDAIDFGDLQEPRYGNKACSNGHGGL